MQAARVPRRRIGPWLSLLGVSLLVIGAVLWDVGPGLRSLLPARSHRVAAATGVPPPSDARRTARLFFLHADKPLLVERSEEVPRRSTVADEVRVVLRMLAARATEDLKSPLPPGLEVRQIFLDSLGVLYLDCTKAVRAVATGPGGSDLGVSAIVLSLAGTFSEVKRVQFLADGEEISLAAGSVDLRRPINPRFPGEEERLVVPPPPPEQS